MCVFFFVWRNFFRPAARSLCCQHGLHGGFSGGACLLAGTGSCQRTSAKTSCSSRFPCDVALPRQRELQQRSREGAVHCNCKELRPSRDPCGPDGRGGGRCPVAREQAQPGEVAASAPNRPPNNHQAAGTGAHKLGVRLAPFTAGCSKERPAWLDVCPRLRLPVAGDRADDGRVDSLLQAVPHWHPVGNDFDGDRNIDVHVREAYIAGNTSPSLLADTRHARQLALKAARAKPALLSWRMPRGGPPAGPGVLGKRMRVERQAGQSQPAQQDDPEPWREQGQLG